LANQTIGKLSTVESLKVIIQWIVLCPIILKLRLFLVFPTHPEIKPSAYKYPFFGIGGLCPH